MDLAEFILKMFTIGFFIGGVLGMILQSASFQAQTKIYDNTRLAIDLMHAIAAAPCITETVSGEVRKGVIDSSKLSLPAKDFCVHAPVEFYAKISESGKNIYTIGSDFQDSDAITKSLPILIKYPDKTAAGVLNVKIR